MGDSKYKGIQIQLLKLVLGLENNGSLVFGEVALDFRHRVCGDR
jgi:hypothetical protein